MHHTLYLLQCNVAKSIFYMVNSAIGSFCCGSYMALHGKSHPWSYRASFTRFHETLYGHQIKDSTEWLCMQEWSPEMEQFCMLFGRLFSEICKDISHTVYIIVPFPGFNSESSYALTKPSLKRWRSDTFLSNAFIFSSYIRLERRQLEDEKRIAIQIKGSPYKRALKRK